MSEIKVAGSKYIPVYDDEEIEGIRLACKIGRVSLAQKQLHLLVFKYFSKFRLHILTRIDSNHNLIQKALDAAHAAAKVGVTTDEIDEVVHKTILDEDAYPSPLNYYGFPKSYCSSINEVICHGIPDVRPLAEGDILNCDISVFKDGYHGDLNETYLIGECAESSKKLVTAAYDCLMKAIDACKPGVMYRQLGNIISSHVEEQGLSVVRSYCGHGIGKLFHCNPNVPHYKGNKANGFMKTGHIFTIEPMINAGKWKDKLWNDNWTAVTCDGQRSAQFEHTLLITDDG